MSGRQTRADWLGKELTRKNMAALAAGGQSLALAWLAEAPAGEAITLARAETGEETVLSGGLSQASRRDPAGEALAWLAAAPRPPAGRGRLLFGFGSPWAARLILDEGRPLTVFEPDPLLALAVLSGHDFSAALADPDRGFRLFTPWDLAAGRRPPAADLLIHPPARRRAPAQLAGLINRLARPERNVRAAGPDFRLLVVPPLSGGSESVAESLAQAGRRRGFRVRYLDWGPELKARERAAQGEASAEKNRALAALLAETGREAAQAAAEFQPDLALALAQAPLTAPALAALRDRAPQAVLAFWLVEDFRLFPYALELAPAYDALFHIQAGLIEPALRDRGLSRACYLPLAADPAIFRPRPDSPAPYQAELSFMGAGYPNRVRLLGRLAADYWPRSGRPPEAFKIFGSGWPRAGALKARLFEGGRRVETWERALIYAGGRINLNIHSSPRDEEAFDDSGVFVNPRTFEIAAAGGLQIVDARPLLPPLFVPGREAAVAESPEQLPDLIERYLNSPEEAEALGRAARARAVAEHSFESRLDKILIYLGFQLSRSQDLSGVL